jgi:hypothetical protein
MTGKRIILAVLSVALALVTNYVLQSLIAEDFKLVVEKCSAGDYDGLDPFEPMLGGTFVCIITPFFRNIVRGPSGFFVWGTIVTLFLVAEVHVMVESTREGTKGLLLSPFVVFVIGQFVGISVAFPLLWVPSFMLWKRGTAYGFAEVHKILVIVLSAWVLALSALMFVFQVDTYYWTFTAGLVGGPFFAFPLLLKHLVPLSLSSNGQASKATIVQTYDIVIVVATLVWMGSVASLIHEIGFDASNLWDVMWNKTNSSVQFIQIDWIVWFLSLLIIVGDENLRNVVQTMVLATLIGPGAATALALRNQKKDSQVSNHVKVD